MLVGLLALRADDRNRPTPSGPAASSPMSVQHRGVAPPPRHRSPPRARPHGQSLGSAAIAAARANGRPPQFVVASFDGAADRGRYLRWRRVARRSGARFTFFVSGVYLLEPSRRDLYDAPGRGRGQSDIGFANGAGAAAPRQNVVDVLTQIRHAHWEGHEIGTHYNGHFCGPSGIDTWDAADWGSEIDQARALLVHASTNNRLRPAIRMPFGARAIVGGRTPCLEGDKDVLYPVLRRKGFRYDASRAADAGDWPRRITGIWSFPLPLIPLQGHRYRVLAMDYNFYVNQSGARRASRASAAAYEHRVYASYMRYFRSTYRGNRAPISIGNHFAGWNHGAYENALERFLVSVCRRPEVACVPYRRAADWLDARAARQARDDAPSGASLAGASGSTAGPSRTLPSIANREP